MAGDYLDTDLNVSPYYDDFDFEKGYNRILFKPSVPVQARELTQLQTMLQNQIAKFGENILKAGTIVNGCTLSKFRLSYVKVIDRATVDGVTDTVFAIGDYSNGYLVQERGGSTNLTMQIETVKSGFEINNPDLNTFYGRYLNTGKTSTLDANGNQTQHEGFFKASELKFYDANGQINSVSISTPGTGYTNGDILIFTSQYGSNATANVTTDASGNITAVNVTDSGSGFLYTETVNVSVNTATGTGAVLSAVYKSNVTFTVANSSLEIPAPSLGERNTTDLDYELELANAHSHQITGKTMAYKVSDGVIFQKGHFVDVDPHIVLVDRYNSKSNNFTVGFKTTEEVIDSNIDESLLDNAAGFNNENAPGADRLKLSANLVSIKTSEVASQNNFFGIIKVDRGTTVRIQEETEYSQIGREMAQRTYEESGDYVVSPFNFSTEDITANSTHDRILISSGKAYVKGFRNETVGTSRVSILKGLTTANVDNVTVSQNFGNYVEVEEFLGVFQFQYGTEIKLMDTAGHRISRVPGGSSESIPTGTGDNVTASAPDYDGNVMGTAKVRSVRYDSGIPGAAGAKFRVYLFDINMNSGREFRNVKALYKPGVGFADVALSDVQPATSVLLLNGTSQNDDGDALANPTPGIDAGFRVLQESDDEPHIVLEDALQDNPGFAKLKEIENKVLIRPLPTKGIKTLNHKPSDNAAFTYRTLTSATMQNNGSITFSLTGDRTFPYTGGSTLSETEENEFVIVANGATAQTANLTGTVTTISGSRIVLGTSSDFVNELMVGDTIRVHGGNTGIITGITNATHLEVKNEMGIARSANQYARVFLDDKHIHLQNANTTNHSNAVVSSTANSITINATRGKGLFGSQTLDVNIMHNVKKSNASQKDKVLNANTYVKLDLSSNAKGTSGPWSLGIPDVYDIQKVYVATGNSTVAGSFTGIEAQANSSGGDKTSDFVLDTMQEDGFYGLSRIRQIASPSLALNANTKILVVLRAFTQTGDGYGYFSVDSYPIDDDTGTLPADKIRTEDIPVYMSTTNGKVFDLRDSIDFRKYAGNTANVSEATTASSATTNPANTIAFGESSSTEQFMASPGAELSIDYQHYLPRVDTLVMGSHGQLTLKQGIPAINPVPPRPGEEGMPLAKINVPVFPSLSSKVGREANRTDYTYSIQNTQIRNYTMKDINQIKQDVEKLQYYTSLTNLEKEANDLTIPSSANTSLDRFKNGILVDNFSSRSPADMLDREFKAGYDTARNILTSRTKRQVIDIKPNSYSNTQIKNSLITLKYGDKEDIKQGGGTRFRNTAEASWQFNGFIKLYPDYDNYFDVRHNPENDVTIDIDLTAGTQSLLDNLNEIEGIQQPSEDVIASQSRTNFLGTTQNRTVTGTSHQRTSGGTNIVSQVETTTTQHFETIKTEELASRKNLLTGTPISRTQKVGTFVKDMKFNPYIREQTIKFYGNGFKPNTRHFVYFDGKAKSDMVTPCTVVDDAFVDGVITADEFRTTGQRGDILTSNERGEIFGELFIEPSTYAVGDRQFVIAEKSTVASARDSADSSGRVSFNAFNHSVEKTSVETSTKQLHVATRRITTGTTTRTTATQSGVSTTAVSNEVTGFIADPPPPPPRPAPSFPIDPTSPETFQADGDGDGDGDDADDGGDPLAQTFVVKQDGLVSGAYYTKVDLFFASKDPNLGINIEIRRTENGYPTTDVIPYSRTSIKSADVNISDDGSEKTTATFENPVFLKNDSEYALVFLPQSANPNYNVFVRKTGEPDLITGQTTVKDTFTGMMFVSSNDRAWKPYVDEDVKFTMHRAQFQAGVGSVQYELADQEFATLSDINGNFEQGEKVFKYDVSANLTGTAQFTSTSETVTGSGTLFSSEIALGNFVTLSNGTSHSTHKVTGIASNTSMTVQGFPNFSAQSSNTANVMFSPTGTVEFYENTSANKEMFIKDTTASNSTFLFANTNVIIGSRSSANAILSEVKNLETSGFENLMYMIEPEGTELTQYQQGNTATGVSGNNAYQYDDTNRLPAPQYIKSRSNEIADGTGKSWKHTFTFKTSVDMLSPTIDDSVSNINRLQNLINDDVTNEYLPGEGSALAKYISKVVTLDEGLDAEDIKVFVTSTRPPGTNVRVYGRILNEFDPEPFGDKHWSILARVGDDTFTDPNRQDDFIEMEFGFPNKPPSTRLLGNAQADFGNNVLLTSTDLQSAVAPNDIIRIVNDPIANDYQVEVLTAESATSLTVANELQFDNSQAELHKLDADGLQTAFLDPQERNIVTYFNSNQIRFNGYKSFQIKIVLTSPDITRVPRVSDYRAIAVTI